MKKTNGLEIEPEAFSSNHTEFFLQKTFQLILILIIVAAFLGLFGNGLFGTCRPHQDGLTLEYNYFSRIQALDVLTVHIDSNTLKLNDNTLKIWASTEYFNRILVRQIIPTPSQQELNGNYIIYTFHINPKEKHIALTFLLEPQGAGFHRNSMGVVNGPSLNFNQFIYP